MSPSDPESRPDRATDHPWHEWAEAVQQSLSSARPSQDLSRTQTLVLGLTGMLLIALLFPVYDHYLRRELRARDAAESLRRVAQEANKELQKLEAANQEQAQRLAARQRRERIRAVRVTGVIDGEEAVAIVVLGNASTDEAADTICTQAERQLRRSLSGQLLKVQRARGNQPAEDAGWVECR